jgi:hypothetical protein
MSLKVLCFGASGNMKTKSVFMFSEAPKLNTLDDFGNEAVLSRLPTDGRGIDCGVMWADVILSITKLPRVYCCSQMCIFRWL